MTTNLDQMRWLLFEPVGSSISRPLLVVVAVWLAIIFDSIGPVAPPNPAAIEVLMLAALSVSVANFLILELDQPFGCLIQIPNQPKLKQLHQLAN